jgi:hypothetical protein
MYKKVTSRSYNYFLDFICSNFFGKKYLQLCQKMHNFIEKAQGTLGVKVKSHGLKTILRFIVPHLKFYLEWGHITRSNQHYL